MFELDRTFCQLNGKTGMMEWFFSAREGLYGPFSSKEKTLKELDKFIKFNIKNSNDGGRKLMGDSKLSLAPRNGSTNAIKLTDTMHKRGEEF